MKNLKFYLIIAALAIIVIGIGICLYKEHQTVTKLLTKDATVKKQILTDAKEISRAVKANGIESVLFDITGNHTSIKNVDNTDMPDIVDTAALALDIRTKQLNEVTVIAAQFKAEKLQLIAKLDSMKHVYYTYNENGLDLKLTPPFTPAGVATADFMGRFGIIIAKGTKAKWFTPWNKRDLLSVTSDSKYFTVDHVKYIGFDKEPFPLHASLHPEITYNQFTGISTGPSMKIEIGRLNLSANYQYYDKFKGFSWGGTASYKLVGF